MKVILRKDVKHLGLTGSVKEVKPGYARNYLLPNGMAELATEGSIKNWKLGEERRQVRINKELDAARKQAEKMAGTVLSFSRKVGENSQLFGSVTKLDIVKSLAAAGFKIEKEAVELLNPIKTLGESEVVIFFMPGVTAKIKANVTPQQAE